jgi:hypothetical protein
MSTPITSVQRPQVVESPLIPTKSSVKDLSRGGSANAVQVAPGAFVYIGTRASGDGSDSDAIPYLESTGKGITQLWSEVVGSSGLSVRPQPRNSPPSETVCVGTRESSSLPPKEETKDNGHLIIIH